MKDNSFKNVMKIIEFSGPVILSSVSSLIASLLSTRLLGMENKDNLYFLALFLPISYALIGICETIRIAGLSYSGMPVKNLILNVASLILVAMIFFIFAIIIFLLFKNQMISSLKVKQVYRENFLQFSIGMLLAGFVMGLSSALNASLLAIRKIHTAMFISILASFLVVLLTYFIAYRMKLGLEGYIFAIFLAYFFSGFLSICLLRSHGLQINEIRFIKATSLFNRLKEATKIIIPVGTSFIIIFSALFLTNKILSHFAQNVLSGFGVAYRIQALILLPAIGLGTAISLLRDNKTIMRTGLIFSTLIYFIIGILVYNFRDSLSNFVAQDPEISNNSAIYLKFVSISYIGNGPLISYLTFLEQTGHAYVSLFVNFFYFSLVLIFGGGVSILFHHYQILYSSILLCNLAAFLLVLIIIIKEIVYE